MPLHSGSDSDVKFEIGHVLFIDIVGYSKLLMHEQSEQLQKLKEIVRGTEQFRLAEAEGKLLRLPTGDGGALVFRTTLEAPVLCAIEISKALKKHPSLRVRMGIHSGPVNEISDLNEQANIAGAGINIAQRVMDCADAGHILLSKHVAEDLEDFARWRPYLHAIGECAVKHGRTVSLVNFYDGEIGNPQLPSKCSAFLKTTPSKPRFISRPVIVAAATVLILALVAAVLIVTGVMRFGRRVTVNTKSIAVLPFENLSHEADNAYFADGIQEEILTRLSQIADLKVISRTSTQRYKSSPSNLSDIASRLGVAHILEGSVQKSGDQVRVNVQLINALSDSHLWADKFDRRLTDIFAVESEIATKIADTLKARLTGAEQHALTFRPTQNTVAHELYLRGRFFANKRNQAADLLKAIEYYNQALAQDPNHAPAYAGLAEAYAILPSWTDDYTIDAYAKAKTAAQKAVALDDNLAEAHAALALVSFNEFKLKEERLELERAIALSPNFAAAHYYLGFEVLCAVGDLDRAIVEIKTAQELDPLSVPISLHLGMTYKCARRYPEALAQLNKTLELEPNFFFAYDIIAEVLAYTGKVDEAIDNWKHSYDLAKNYHTLTFIGYGYGLKGEREKALQIMGQLKEMEQRGEQIWTFGYGLIHMSLGEKQQAMDYLEQSWKKKEVSPLPYIRVDPMFDPLRGDPRFEKLANEIIPASVK
jgi:adenylate cyclase